MKLRALSEATTALRNELRAKIGHRADLTLDDVPAEHRELARAIVGDKPRFSALDLEVGLEDAYIALRRADEKALLGILPRPGWRDGEIQPRELQNAQKQNAAASPLYRMIENRLAAHGRASAAVKAADDDGRQAFKELLDALGPKQREAAFVLSMVGYERAAQAFDLKSLGATRAGLEAKLERAEGSVPDALAATRRYLDTIGVTDRKLAILGEEIGVASHGVESAHKIFSESDRDRKVAEAVVSLEKLRTIAYSPKGDVTGGELHAAERHLEYVKNLTAVPDADKAQAIAQAETALEALRPQLAALVREHAPIPSAELEALAGKVASAVERRREAEAAREALEVHAEPMERSLFHRVDDGSYYLKLVPMFPDP